MTRNGRSLALSVLLSAGSVACAVEDAPDVPRLRVAGSSEHGDLFTTTVPDGPRLLEAVELDASSVLVVYSQTDAPCLVETTQADEIVERLGCREGDLELATAFAIGEVTIVDEQFRLNAPTLGGLGGFSGFGGTVGGASGSGQTCINACNLEAEACMKDDSNFVSCPAQYDKCIKACGSTSVH